MTTARAHVLESDRSRNSSRGSKQAKERAHNMRQMYLRGASGDSLDQGDQIGLHITILQGLAKSWSNQNQFSQITNFRNIYMQAFLRQKLCQGLFKI